MTPPRPILSLRLTSALTALALLFRPALVIAQNKNPGNESTLQAALTALAEGRPYLASTLLEPLLADSAAPAGIVLLGAKAAAEWEAWGRVVRLLREKPWLDRLDGGEGRALLARARLERGEDAVEDARLSLAGATESIRGARLLTLARAFDRAGQLDSASATYRAAAAALPDIADWLVLRAAGVTADSALRDSLYAQVVLPAALPRIRWTEALVRDRSGDLEGAADRYDALGSRLTALRLRLRAAPDSEDAGRLKEELLQLLAPRRTADEARGAIALLDATFAPLSLSEELVVARRAAGVDRAARAVAGFTRVAALKPLADSDLLVYGSALARQNRHREAMGAFAAITAKPLRAEARYAQARSLLAVGRTTDGIERLKQISAELPLDSAVAAQAGFLAGEMLGEAGDDAGARREFRSVAERFPRTLHGSRAAFQAALIAFLDGNSALAAAEFSRIAARPGDQAETAAALYWSGRALAQQGDTAGARARWRTVWERFPLSYYVLPASVRLGLPAEMLPRPGEPPAPDSTGLVVLRRAAQLEALGLRTEARFEYDRVVRMVDSTPGSLPGIAEALAEAGQTSRAYRLALRSSDPRLMRLAYPLPHRADLFAAAGTAGVDPLLASAIIRQESAFDPAALSRADAMGLMQVLPSVGAALAKAEGISDWTAALLNEPEINLRFGMSHLAQGLRRFARLEHTLAAYNAGARPAERWLALRGAKDDPEVFIERIGYVETRDYVRRVLRNLSVYRVLYPAIP